MDNKSHMMLLDTWDIIQRHAVNAAALVQFRVHPEEMADLGNITADELNAAYELFTTDAKGKAYADLLQHAPHQVARLLGWMHTVGVKVPGTPQAARMLRSEAIAGAHAFGTWTSFNTFNPSELHHPLVMRLAGHAFNISGPYGAPDVKLTMMDRWKAAARDPVACAQFYHIIMDAITTVLYGWPTGSPRQTNASCAFGPMSAFFHRAECSGRQALHSHGQTCQPYLQPAAVRALTSPS
jgi:hypothetical protein